MNLKNRFKYSHKKYKCRECGHEKTQGTNHYGATYGMGSFNQCPKCPPYKRPTIWDCAEIIPEGGWVPKEWTHSTITIDKKGGAK